MTVIVRIIDTDKIWQLTGVSGKTIREILKSIGLIIEEYVISRNGEIVSEDEIVGEDDYITLYPVVSGG